MDWFLRQQLIEFRDKIKEEAEESFSWAGSNDNEIESRLELQFSNVLFRLYNELKTIINENNI
jgi:hypothetical protein